MELVNWTVVSSQLILAAMEQIEWHEVDGANAAS